MTSRPHTLPNTDLGDALGRLPADLHIRYTDLPLGPDDQCSVCSEPVDPYEPRPADAEAVVAHTSDATYREPVCSAHLHLAVRYQLGRRSTRQVWVEIRKGPTNDHH